MLLVLCGVVSLCVVLSVVLMLKECVIFELFVCNLLNKEIVVVFVVGEEIVKWYLKNLFGKFDVSLCKYVVCCVLVFGLFESVF